MQTIKSTEEVIEMSRTLKVGVHRIGVMDLAAAVEDQSVLGESLRNFILRTRMDRSLRSFELGFLNMFKISDGLAAKQDMWRVLAAIGYAPIVVTRGNESMRRLIATDADTPDYVKYLDTDFGPVVHFNLNRIGSGEGLSLFVNPKGLKGFEFLTALYAFPLLTWVVVTGDDQISIGQYARAEWPDEVMKFIVSSSRKNVEPSALDFSRAVEIARQMSKG